MEALISLWGEWKEGYIHTTYCHILHHGMAEESSILLAPYVHNFHSCGWELYQCREKRVDALGSKRYNYFSDSSEMEFFMQQRGNQEQEFKKMSA